MVKDVPPPDKSQFPALEVKFAVASQNACSILTEYGLGLALLHYQQVYCDPKR